MIQLIRNFSVQINLKAFNRYPDIRFTRGYKYPVLGIEYENEKGSCLIIADDDGVLNWMSLDELKVVEVQP